MIIGITGPNASGKDTVAGILEKKGFIHYSLSDILRDELKKLNREETRENLISIGNELRKKYNPSVLAEKTIQKFEAGKDYVVTSIRNPREAEALLKQPNFHLVYLNAPIKIRYRRYDKEKISFKEFLNEERIIENSKKEHELRLNDCKKLANIELVNDSTLTQLRKKVDKMLDYLKETEKYVRPSWDEYFLSMCDVAGTRGTCERGRIASIITRERRIISTGYAGSPPGLPHCDEVGHEMKSMLHEDGSVSKHCVRTIHAEMNAICQAAKYGIFLDGGTLYCKATPCYTCAKSIIASGIKRVVCKQDYHASRDSVRLFKEAKIELEIKDKTVLKYKNQ